MRRILLTIAMAICAVAMQAQLSIEQIFNAAWASDPNVTEAVVTGKAARKINSRLERLAFFKADAAVYGERVCKLILADAHNASGRDLRYSDGKLSYAYLALNNPQPNSLNTYLYFVESRRKTQSSTIIVVLLEGKLSAKEQAKIIESLKKNKK